MASDVKLGSNIYYERRKSSSLVVIEIHFFLSTEQNSKICKKPYYPMKCRAVSLFRWPIELASTKWRTMVIRPCRRVSQGGLG